MVIRSLALCVAISAWAFLPVKNLQAADPMDVFKPLVGEWTTKLETRPSLANPQKATGAGELKVQMILGGRYIRSEGFGEAPRIGRQEYHVIMTYDSRQRIYRRWVFRSDGIIAESKGVWNAETKTMTWTTIGLPKNVSFTATTRITENGFEETLLGKRADGKVSLDVTSTARRKK